MKHIHNQYIQHEFPARDLTSPPHGSPPSQDIKAGGPSTPHITPSPPAPMYLLLLLLPHLVCLLSSTTPGHQGKMTAQPSTSQVDVKKMIDSLDLGVTNTVARQILRQLFVTKANFDFMKVTDKGLVIKLSKEDIVKIFQRNVETKKKSDKKKLNIYQ